MLEYNGKQKKEEEQMNSKGKNLKNEEIHGIVRGNIQKLY